MSETNLAPLLARVSAGDNLSREDTANAFTAIMSGEVDPVQIAALLTALRMRGETVEELTGAAETMRAKATTLTAPSGAIDVCGTGGDGSGTYNISTAVSFVVAACNVPVAKHGNRAASSKSGAADVLAALGVNLDAPLPVIERAIAEIGIGFLFAARHHSAMRFVGPVRKTLGFRTIFNLLGPLSNPAGAKRQLLGVFDAAWLVPMAETLKALGSDAAWIVHGSDGLDELTVTGESHVAALTQDGSIREMRVTPQDAGLSVHEATALKGGEAEENAEALRAILQGSQNAYRDITLLNSAAALIVAGKANDLRGGAEMAAQAIDTGTAMGKLEALIALTNEAA